MKKIGVEQAKIRYDRAVEALSAMEQSTTFDAFEKAWAQFLLDANGVYPKLKEAARGNGTSEGWYSRKKHDRKKDPLLSYLHHARDCHEHSIEPITRRDSGGIGINTTGRFQIHRREGKVKITHFGDEPVEVQIIAPHAKLIPVRDDRYGDTFDPPRNHLGAPLSDNSPVIVAKLALRYLDSIIAEAAKEAR
jgi:hypothetical protein